MRNETSRDLFTQWSDLVNGADPMWLLVIVGGLFGLLLAFLLVQRGAGEERRINRLIGEHPDVMRTQALAGRFERLQANFQDLNEDAIRTVALLRNEVESLRHRLDSKSQSPDSKGSPSLIAEAPEGATVSQLAAPVQESKKKDQTEQVPELKIEKVKETPIAAAPREESIAKDGVTTSPAPQVGIRQPLKAADNQLATSLQKSRRGFFESLRSFFSRSPKIDESHLEELEAILVGADVGVKTAQDLLQDVRSQVKSGQEVHEDALVGMLKMRVLTILEGDDQSSPEIEATPVDGKPRIVVVVGVNGAGKTTTIAKLGENLRARGAKVLLVAADTFRAAAVAQLSTWGERIGIPVVSGTEDAKPQTVVFEGMRRAQEERFDVVLVDTAGRLHTKTNLMQELAGVRGMIERHIPGAPHEVLLVVDGSSGQNALAQAREFNQAMKLTGLIVTKLDGTPKGGIVVAIRSELGVPIRYIGIGEASSDLKPFEARAFVDALLEPIVTEGSGEIEGLGGARRRRRRGEEAVAN